MMWSFILVVPLVMPHQRGAVAESVHLDNQEQCIGYARGRMSSLPLAHTALCVNRRTGEIIDVRRSALVPKGGSNG